MSHRKLGLLAMVIGAAVIWALPAVTLGQGDVKSADQVLREATQQLGDTVQQSVTRTAETVRRATSRTGRAASGGSKTRAPATDPQVQPPAHGSNPRAQGSVAVVDANPSAERPYGDSTDGTDTGEDIIAGRSRAEQQDDGSYRGHITILELFGNELAGVNTTNGEDKQGPLEPIQTGILDPLCNSSGICLSLLTANSKTESNGSSNDFAVARAQVGGPDGLTVGAAESQAVMTQTDTCQAAAGRARTANVRAGGGVTASAANSSSASSQCRGEAEKTENTSEVLNLLGQPVPIPSTGCAEGIADTRITALAPVATIVCNADEMGASGVRHALDVFVLSAGGTSLAQESSAQSESRAVAPPAAPTAPTVPSGRPRDEDGRGAGERAGRPECSDRRDNDGDGLIDARDPGCHTDGNANNPASYDSGDDSEADGRGAGGPGGGRGGAGAPECSDRVDNDGDGVIDSRDPGCHTDGNANNPDSYNPADDSEADGARGLRAGALPFTGTDVIGLILAGLLVLAGGLMLRRRGDLPARG